MNTPSARREFLKHTGLLGAASVLSSRAVSAQQTNSAQVIDEYHPTNVKLARRVPGSLNDDDMKFLQQLGLRWVRVDLSREQANLAFMAELQQRFARHDIRIYSAVHPVQSSIKIGLGLDGRDAEIAEYQRFLQALANDFIDCQLPGSWWGW